MCGTTAVNALSTKFQVKTVNDGIQYQQNFEFGLPVNTVHKVTKKTMDSGTEVCFYPDIDVMQELGFDLEILEKELDSKAYIINGVKFILKDLDTKESKEYYHKNGISDFIRSEGKLLYDPIIIKNESKITIKDKEFKIEVEIGLSHSKDISGSIIKAFTNTIYNYNEGTHVAGFRIGITSNIKKYIDSNNMLSKKDEKLNITGDNIQDGLIAIINLKYPNALYSSQTKEKLTSTEIQGYILKVINDELPKWMDIHSKEMKILCNQVILSAKAENAAKKAKEAVTKKGTTTLTIMSDLSKLAVCNSKDYEKCELFITEGNSASSSAKACRDKNYQAIYALRGKILNSNNVSKDIILTNKELSDLVYILTGKKDAIDDKFDIADLKYGKILTLCDADDDGYNITSLIITFFYKHMKDIITNGCLYVCQPPLYSIIENGKKRYFLNQEKYDEYIIEKIKNKYNFNYNITNVISWCDKYNNFLDELSNNTGLPQELFDIYSDIVIKNNFTADINQLVKLGDLIINGNNVSGLFSNYYIDLDFNDFIDIIEKVITYRANIGYPNNLKLNNQLFYNKDYKQLLSDETPKSRSRFKGLGEMDADELGSTTIDKKYRQILKVVLQDNDESASVQEDLFNQNTKYSDRRKILLLDSQNNVINELEIEGDENEQS